MYVKPENQKNRNVLPGRNKHTEHRNGNHASPRSGFTRAEKLTHRNLCKLFNNTTNMNAGSAVLQRVPIKAVITGLTHLVKVQNGSMFNGEEVGEVTEGTEIEIENSDKIRSRRGPNQENNRANDLSGDPVYRWVRVTKINGRNIPPQIYVRDDTFETEVLNPLGPVPSVISDEQRTRSDDLPIQEVYLVGTRHDMSRTLNDHHEKITPEVLDGADLIVEHPTPSGRGVTVIDKGVQDLAQNTIINTNKEHGNKANVIGADGRKAFDGQKIHALSIRSQGQSFILAPGVNTQVITDLLEQFVEACLGIGQHNITTIVGEINALGHYQGPSSAPDVEAVLMNVYQRVHTITQYFTPEVKLAIKNKVMNVFNTEVEEGPAVTQSYLDDLVTQKEEGKVTEAEYERFKADLTATLRLEIIPPFHDAISNLTLFADTLASNKPKVVVAFGNEHVAPLRKLLEEVNKLQKVYDIKTL